MAQFNNLNVMGCAEFGNTLSGGNIHTSFSPYETCNGSVSLGEIQGTESCTVDQFVSYMARNVNGCMGSLYINASYTLGSVTMSAGWYTYIWIPDTGYKVQDEIYEPDHNKMWGTIIFSGMTIDGFLILRMTNGSAASLHKWY